MEDIVSYLLDGLEAALMLERELGVRSLEVDRELLKNSASGHGAQAPLPKQTVSSVAEVAKVAEAVEVKKPSVVVFLHDRALSPAGAEIMEKIIAALGLTTETAPVILEPPVSKARFIVVLGGRAMKRYYPEMRGEPGQWLKAPTGEDVLITYSPEYILRFGTVTPAVQKLKQDMWRSLKAIKQRLMTVS